MLRKSNYSLNYVEWRNIDKNDQTQTI